MEVGGVLDLIIAHPDRMPEHTPPALGKSKDIQSQSF